MDIQAIRSKFPTLTTTVQGKPLVYFDNGATSQKPSSVINRLKKYYETENANVHRGVHTLSQIATESYEEARRIIQRSLNAKESHEIIFTKGTTDGINLVATSFGATLEKGDEIIISEMEHHSNIVPWQMLCERQGCVLKYIPITTKGELEMEKLDELMNSKTRLISITHISNALGTINDIQSIIQKAHQNGIKVMIDAAQSIQHFPIDVQALDCDFLAFSGHKVFGPTGIGVLYGKEAILQQMPPYQGGGDMIEKVTLAKTTYNTLPYKFEAGTPNIADTIGLGAAFEFINDLDWEEVHQYETELLDYATTQLKQIEGLKIYGEAQNKASVISFLVDGTHPYDVGTLLDKMGIAVRTGHHCAQPIMDKFEIPGTIRASFSIYNTKEEIDFLINALQRVIPMLKD